MSYIRVIPRDLFNEGNLLKCYGQIYLNLERMRAPAELVEDDSTEDGFHIVQNEDSGGITLTNVRLVVRGQDCRLERPLNARRPYPLYLTPEDGDELPVFNDDGSFTADMVAFLTGGE